MNLAQIFEKFPTRDICIKHLEMVRWQGYPVCPYCRSDKATSATAEQRHHCNNCKTSFSVTVGTIFHHTHLPLQKWFLAIALVFNARTGLSARQLAHDLQVNKNTGWRMATQIHRAMMQSDQCDFLSRTIEFGEIFIDSEFHGSKINSDGRRRNRNSRYHGSDVPTTID